MSIQTIILYAIAIIVVGVITLQFMSFKQWLVWACSQAENALGAGTGKLKLKYCYDLAVNRFPVIAKIIPFAMFSKLVDKALVTMKEMIANNEHIANAINGIDKTTIDTQVVDKLL